ncbi:MAG: DegT/DnrJ/EryC1/StrS family aminotransferase [Proteobacteria bacterium]|nr:DegT/DnrJ/EryC1/StrS family aminotransferase [Pseudomonadota bacterium]MBU1739431.1 DegT/DnrJ/EryC1/StrS family aminotransferase [Pseudomonadota bacterium]
MKTPLLDLKQQYALIQEEALAAIAKVLDSTSFAGGPFVEEFEKNFADFCQCRHAVGVGSGTDALWIALRGLGIGAGDEVITVPNSFIATAEAISQCGAVPVFVDIDEESYTMNPDLLEAALTPKTRAIIPVHLYGQMADMDPILRFAEKHGLVVIEDAAQAHGAEYKGRRAGSLGRAGCFSFYPGKNLGAYGEAGAVVTNDETLAARMRIFRDHGQQQKYHHSVIGWNSRMDGIQGAILDVKLKHLPLWNAARRKNAALYTTLLEGTKGVALPSEAKNTKHVYHIYPVRLRNRDRVLARLAEKKIFCGIHYPVPIHLQQAYAGMGFGAGMYPVAEKYAGEQLSLPMFPELTEQQINYVTDEIRQIVT